MNPKAFKYFNNGFTFSPHEKKKQSPFERLFDIFQELIVFTSGDVDETLNWMDELDREYKLYSDEYSKKDFIEDLKKKGFLNDAPQKNKGKSLQITSKTEQLIRQRSLNQIFGSLKKSGQGNHKTKYSGRGDDYTGDLKNYVFGDSVDKISMTESIKNCLLYTSPSPRD